MSATVLESGEALLDWVEIMDAIGEHLDAETAEDGTKLFETVANEEPIGLPSGGPHARYWYLGRRASNYGGERTLDNVMYAARVQIGCWWPVERELAARTFQDRQVAVCDTSMRRRFRGDSRINSNVTDIEITDSEVTLGGFPGLRGAGGGPLLYHALMFELQLDNLEGERIVA